MDSKDAQMELKNKQNWAPRRHQVPRICKMIQRRWQSGASSVTMASQSRCNARTTQEKTPKLQTKRKKVQQIPKNKQTHIDHTPKQPTNQGNKERRESANNETNEQTPTYTFTQTNTLTTRPQESSFKLQTQTQTPAAGCSPKAT